jgi:hypothetical protein
MQRLAIARATRLPLADVADIPLEDQIGRTAAEVCPSYGLSSRETSGPSRSEPGRTRHWLTSFYPGLTFVNRAGAGMLGWTTDELAGKAAHDVLHPRGQATASC